jgi:hypothetical protein
MNTSPRITVRTLACLTTLGGAAIATVLASTPAIAQPFKAPTSVGTPTSPCNDQVVRIPDNYSTGQVPTAHRAGQPIVVKSSLRNTRKAALKHAYIRLSIASPVKRRTPAPTVQWKLGNGPWRMLSFTWYDNDPTDPQSIPSWDTHYASPYIGTLSGHSTHQIQLKFTFHKGDSAGYYFGTLQTATDTCADLGVGGVDTIFKSG